MKRFRVLALAVFALLLSQGLIGTASYSSTDIPAEVKSLALKTEMAPDKIFELVNKVEATLKDPALPEAVKKSSVSAILVFHAVEAGFGIKYMKGDGLINFEGGRKEAPVTLKSWSAGAQIGGSAQWGAGLVLDLKTEADFGGDYRGEVKAATAADTTTKGGVLLANDKGQKIFFITFGRGFSAGVSKAKLTITPGW